MYAERTRFVIGENGEIGSITVQNVTAMDFICVAQRGERDIVLLSFGKAGCHHFSTCLGPKELLCLSQVNSRKHVQYLLRFVFSLSSRPLRADLVQLLLCFLEPVVPSPELLKNVDQPKEKELL